MVVSLSKQTKALVTEAWGLYFIFENEYNKQRHRKTVLNFDLLEDVLAEQSERFASTDL